MGVIPNPPGYQLSADGSEWVKIPTNSIVAAIVTTGSQIPRPVAAVAATAISPVLYDQAANAVLDGLAGNYVGAITNGVPAIVGIGSFLVALFTPSPSPSPSKGPTDEQIKNAVLGMSDNDKRSLLESAYSSKTIVLSNTPGTTVTSTDTKSIVGSTQPSNN